MPALRRRAPGRGVLREIGLPLAVTLLKLLPWRDAQTRSRSVKSKERRDEASERGPARRQRLVHSGSGLKLRVGKELFPITFLLKFFGRRHIFLLKEEQAWHRLL